MNYLMCIEFINFIKENGRDILKNPQGFESSLHTYCSTKLASNVYKSEVFILSEALREGIIQELLEVKSVNDILIRKLSKQLQATCGFTQYASDGAIDTWCYALGLKEVPVEMVAPIKTENISKIISDPKVLAKEIKNANYMLIGGVIGLIGGFIIELLAANSKSGNKVIGISPIMLGAILLIRGILKMQQIKSNNNVQPEKTNTQYSTNDYYSQKAESTNTNSSDNDNYANKSENVKEQNADADYSKQTSNQSTKKEESVKKEKTFEDRFEELKRLHEKGIITEAEFQTRKTEILKEL